MKKKTYHSPLAEVQEFDLKDIIMGQSGEEVIIEKQEEEGEEGVE